MVESLKELNRICQKPRYKETGNWMVRHFLRDAALPITWLLLHTPVTANQVTFAALVAGIAGSLLIAFPGSGFFLIGALLLQLWYLLDHVDGQIARYRKTAGLTGRFYDFLMHHLIHGVLVFCLGWYVFQIKGQNIYAAMAFTASLSIMMFNLTHDAKYKTFFERISSAKIIFIRNSEPVGEKSNENPSTVRRVVSLLHKLCEIHVLMNLLTVAALLECWRPNLDYRANLFTIYMLMIPFLALAKWAYLIHTKKIDHEFENQFRLQEDVPS